MKGDPKNLKVQIAVSKTPSTITCSAAPQLIEKGETIDVNGAINSAHENVTVTLHYKRPDG